MKFKNKTGFTLIELLVVIVIIGILATLATVALGAARVKARDAKRISDIKQMQTALELYYNEENTYPPTSALGVGKALVGEQSGKTFIGKIPAGPSAGESYTYTQINGGTSYTLGYTLEKPVNEFTAGAAIALPGSVNNQCIADCNNKCSGEMDSCNNAICANPSASSVIVGGVTATANTARTTMTVAWDSLLYSNITYKLEYSQSTNGGSTWSAFTNVSGATALATTTYNHTGRNASYQYKYRVTPTVCSSVVGTVSAESNTSGCTNVTIAPATVTLVPNDAQMTISWSAVTGADSYTVYGNADNSTNPLYTTSNLSYTNTGLTNGTTYYYTVAANVCGVLSAKSTQQSGVANINFSVACTSGTSLGSACGGGWLICKPNDGNCADSPTNYVVVAPTDYSGLVWSSTAPVCASYHNTGDGGGTWSTPKLSSDTGLVTTLSGSRSNNEMCQIMKRSNFCSYQTYSGGCSGGCLSPAPVSGIANAWYWSSNVRDATYAWGQRSMVGDQGNINKTYTYNLRCVRRFN